MFRAELLWLANGPTLKMEGRLVGDWAEQASFLVTADVVPRGLIVDLTAVSYIDSAGERLLSWLGSVGAVFAARGVYTPDICNRLGLSLMQKTSTFHKAERKVVLDPLRAAYDPAVQDKMARNQ